MKNLARYVSLLKGLILGLLVVTSLSAQSAIISVSASENTIEVGDSVDVYFDIEGLSALAGDSLAGFSFSTIFDDSVLAFQGFSFADPLAGNQLDFDAIDPLSFGFFGDVFLLSANTLDIFAVSGNFDDVLDANQIDGFRFLTLSFTATAATANAAIGIDTLFADFVYGQGSQTQTTFNSDTANISINSGTVVNPPTTVPEPSMFWMFLAASALIVNRRKTS